MTKREIVDLFFLPSAVTFVIAVVAFFMLGIIHRNTHDFGDQQTFDKFVGEVQSGKQQLTPDRAIAIIKQERATVDSYLKVANWQAWLIAYIGCLALAGLGLQVIAIFRIQKRLKKP